MHGNLLSWRGGHFRCQQNNCCHRGYTGISLVPASRSVWDLSGCRTASLRDPRAATEMAETPIIFMARINLNSAGVKQTSHGLSKAKNAKSAANRPSMATGIQ